MKKDILDDLCDTQILLVEDDPDLRNLIERSIKRHVKAIYSAGEGKKALKIFKEKSPDIIVADLDLPQMNGIDFLRAVRGLNSKTSIVIITAYGTEENFSNSYDIGVSSILKKPIDLDELFMILLANTPKKKSRAIVSLGNNLSYHPQEMILYCDKKSIMLTKKENQILSLLLQNKGCVVPYGDFQTYVWGNAQMTLDTLRMHINSIRRKTQQDIIKNLSGVGYKLITTP